MAVAPKVSLKYWQKCLERYRDHLSSEMASETSATSVSCLAKSKATTDNSNAYIEYSILAGEYDAAVDELERSRQVQAAKTVKFV